MKGEGVNNPKKLSNVVYGNPPKRASKSADGLYCEGQIFLQSTYINHDEPLRTKKQSGIEPFDF